MPMSPQAQQRNRSIRQIKTRLFDDFVDSELSELTQYKRWLHSGVRIGVMVVRDFVQNLVKLQAMALAFETLLSLAPLLAVVFSLLKAFGVHNRMEPALAEALSHLGEKGQEITNHLIGFVDKMSASALGSVGLVTLFITVLSLMSTIEDSFNHVWRVKSPRKLARRFSDYLSAIVVGPVLVFAAVTITATLQNNAIVHALTSLQAFGHVILFLLRFIPYVTLWGAFSFVYIFIPNTRVRLSSALVGGLVAALLWQTVGWGFAVFVTSSTRYYVIYSSFAILLLFLLWLHVGWMIVLLGAQVAYAHQHIHFYQREHDLVAQSTLGREKLALQLLVLIGRNFYQGLDPINVLELSNRMRLPAGVIQELLQMLTQTRVLISLADEESFVLGRDPRSISIKEILDSVRNGGKKIDLLSDGNQEAESQVNALLLEVDQSVSKALEGQSLGTLIERAGTPVHRLP